MGCWWWLPMRIRQVVCHDINMAMPLAVWGGEPWATNRNMKVGRDRCWMPSSRGRTKEEDEEEETLKEGRFIHSSATECFHIHWLLYVSIVGNSRLFYSQLGSRPYSKRLKLSIITSSQTNYMFREEVRPDIGLTRVPTHPSLRKLMRRRVTRSRDVTNCEANKMMKEKSTEISDGTSQSFLQMALVSL